MKSVSINKADYKNSHRKTAEGNKLTKCLLLMSLIALFALSPLKAFADDSASGDYDGSETLAETVAGDMLISKISSSVASPVIVTAADLITKVYGAIDLPATKRETFKKAASTFKMRPEVDETGMWLDGDAGYALSYSGMTPAVSAVAQFDEENLSGFGYFFVFPYAAGCREEANRDQCAFCSSLLQEMYDMGSIVGVPADEDEAEGLFTALGSYEGNHINVSLKEHTDSDDSGRFLLVLEVTPNVYNLYDSVMASAE